MAKRRFLIAALLALSSALGSCIIVADECDGGEVTCDGEVIEQCVSGNWEFLEDCYDLCAGYCDFDEVGNPVCVC